MPPSEQLKEADRVMRICNACRYCEGFCAVYPAMELRRTFTDRDLRYLANLCHNCRDCYYACQYAPPHEFNLNVPRVFAELRLETYQKYTWPGLLKGLFKKNGLALSLVTVISTVLLLLLALAFNGPAALFSRHLGQNAFYQVIPYNLLVILFSAIGVFTVIALLVGMGIFWKKTAGSLAGLADTRANARAVLDALQLKYLDGGGFGCNYPDHRFSHTRRWFHHLVFYGFILCFCSTVVAAIYDHFMNWPAPYPYFSLPVVLGTLGGSAMLAGTGGLFYLKTKMDAAPAAPNTSVMDLGFIIMLFMTNLTGILLLVLRETAAMGSLLVVHVGIVAGLFITMPYGKFIHAVFRYVALVRSALEQHRADQ